jgi:tRNA/rRNA methyltransferase
MALDGFSQRILDNVAVVLHRPVLSENVGASARAMWNMGISDLIIVEPRTWDEEAALRLATRKASHILKKASFHKTLEEALSGFHFVVGTTARTGDLRKDLWTPEQAANRIIEVAQTNRVAVLFGPEDRGLTNWELRLCNQLVRIPTASFASLNVAQAVLLLCYAIFQAVTGRREIPPSPKLATVEDVERMYKRLEEILIEIGMMKPDYSARGMLKVRRFLSRVGLGPHEVQMIMGLCRQIEWYGKKRR